MKDGSFVPQDDSPALGPSPDTPRGRRFGSWLTRVFIESVAVIASILFALALDEWSEDRDKQELADMSIASFEREIIQNRARLEDVSPFHRGLRDVLLHMDSTGQIRTIGDLRAAVGFEQLQPPFLTDVAWQSAVATGALTHLDFDRVSALSLTYTLQHNFQNQARSTLPDLIRAGSLSEADVRDLLRFMVLYLDEVTTGEEDLKTIYDQALSVIRGQPSLSVLPADERIPDADFRE
jgi:hypothetical protein